MINPIINCMTYQCLGGKNGSTANQNIMRMDFSKRYHDLVKSRVDGWKCLPYFVLTFWNSWGFLIFTVLWDFKKSSFMPSVCFLFLSFVSGTVIRDPGENSFSLYSPEHTLQRIAQELGLFVMDWFGFTLLPIWRHWLG